MVGGSVVAAAAVARAATSFRGSNSTAGNGDVRVVNGPAAVAATPTPTPVPTDPNLLIENLTTGKLFGQYVDGTNIRAFTNIRYARSPAPNYNNSTDPNAPTGRFKAPVPLVPTGEWQDATGEPPSPVAAGGSGTEDCLKLNIWSPTVAPPAGGWPVLVYIYGGGNIGGSIAQDIYSGETFAKKGVICVCINYRVGPLGFLELGGVEDYSALQGSGNNGLKDQILGLKWVRDNISKFNGNPNRVTLAGQSAGAGDVTILYTLPAAQGLFQRAIVVSGGGGEVNEQEVAEEYGRTFVSELQTPTGDNTAAPASGPLYASLPQIAAAYKSINKQKKGGGFKYTGSKRNGFIAESPLTNLENTSTPTPVPLMIGYMRDEIAAGVFPDTVNLDDISISKYGYNYFPDGDAAWARYASIPPTMDDHHKRVRFFSADKFKVPTIAIAQAVARHNQPNVFVYANIYEAHGPNTNGYASHGGDIPFFFNHLDTQKYAIEKFGYTSAEQPMATKIQDAWVRFIWGLSMTVDTVSWTPYNTTTRNMMVFDTNSTLMPDAIGLERQAWIELGAIKP